MDDVFSEQITHLTTDNVTPDIDKWLHNFKRNIKCALFVKPICAKVLRNYGINFMARYNLSQICDGQKLVVQQFAQLRLKSLQLSPE